MKLDYGWIRIGRGYSFIGHTALSSFLYTQWSPDGLMWAAENVTTIPNAPSQVATIKMSNGKYVFLWNPDSDRNKLTMAVATNGRTYSSSYTVRSGLGVTPTYAGAYKGGGPAYPSVIERADGKLLVA